MGRRGLGWEGATYNAAHNREALIAKFTTHDKSSPTHTLIAGLSYLRPWVVYRRETYTHGWPMINKASPKPDTLIWPSVWCQQNIVLLSHLAAPSVPPGQPLGSPQTPHHPQPLHHTPQAPSLPQQQQEGQYLHTHTHTGVITRETQRKIVHNNTCVV